MKMNRIVKAKHIVKDSKMFSVVSNDKELASTDSKEEALTLASQFLNKGYENVKVKTNKGMADNI